MLQDRTNQIEFILREMRDLFYTVQNCYKVIDKLEGNELQDVYIQETIPLVRLHETLRAELSHELKQQFKWEQENNIPRSFKYRLLFNELQKDSILPTSYPYPE